MSSIVYGAYSFPTPLPFAGIEEDFVFLSGQVDHAKFSISLDGEFTGCDLLSLKNQKEALITGLSTGFAELTIGSTGYSYAKPVSINFPESDLNKILPYSITFEAYHEKDFSEFYGIEDPVDSWSYSEQADRTVIGTHTVSAKGIKTSSTDSLVAAKNFVDSRLNDFENISLFFSGNSVIKTSSDESINRSTNEYSVVESYKLSESLNSDISGVIVRPSSQIVYDEDSFSISVNGVIEGGITGVTVDTGYFSPDQATIFARDSVNRSKIDYEDNLYGEILRGPISYQYDIDTGANRINFSFDFGDPTDFRTGDVIHDFSTSFDASKDNGFVSASIDGTVKYNSTNDIFTGSIPENETRYQKVEEYFTGVNPFAILQSHFNYFNEMDLPYSSNNLNDNFETTNITKNPHESNISYSYNYTNKPDLFSGIFRNASLTVNTDYPIPKYQIQESLDNSFAVQETYNSLKRTSVTINGTLNEGQSYSDATTFINNFVSQYSGQSSLLEQDNITTGDNTISVSKSFVISNE